MRSEPDEVACRARRRISRRLIPFLMFIYILAYLDRANLGIAKLGMQTDMKFPESVIGLGAGVFFLGFLVLDVPGSLIVERWSACIWIARIMICWGTVAALMGFLGMPLFGSIPPIRQFYGLRFALGMAEAGFFPGVIVYLSHWYQPKDRSRAKGYFMMAQPIAIATGIPLSRWILQNVHWHGLASWRWVFFLEGVPPIIMGLVTLWYLTDRPENARWLPLDEKQWLIGKLKKDEAQKIAECRVSVVDALRYPQTFLLTAVAFFTITGNQALIFFLPSITDGMKGMPLGVRTLAAALPYGCSAVGILTNGIWAQRTGKLRWHTAVPILATGTWVGLAAFAHQHAWLMVALFCLAGLTAQAYLPAFWSLPTILLGRSAAATAVGLICLGNLGGLAGPWIFGYLKTITGQYTVGLFVLSGCMLLGGLLATLIRSAPVSSPVTSNVYENA